jgi:RHS repeat-associated protein
VSDTSNNYVGYSNSPAKYSPQGTLASMTNGNNVALEGTFTGVVTSNVYNDRLQPILLSAGVTGQSRIFSLCYDFHLGVAVNTSPCPVLNAYTTGDNGNVFQVQNTVDPTRSAAYIYDPLNRIAQAYTLNTTSGNCWGETFSATATAPGVLPSTPGIDPWGNLTNLAGVSGMSGNCLTEGISASASGQNQLSILTYDVAGNVTNDGNGNTPTYDAENRIVTDAGVTYSYDADGFRIEKSSGTMYWPGHPGILAETDLTGTINEEYIYFDGERIARVDRPSGTVHYYFSDKLGSASVITDALGNVTKQDFYFPYGRELTTSTGSDPNHYKFTGKERDAESGLDMFGARYYASTMGRFMSVDPAFESEILELPQTWNRYSYVYNRPTYSNDPDGRCPPCIGALVGGVIEGGFDAGKQFINNGYSFSGFNRREFGASVLGGAVTGGLAVATGGTSLVANAAIGDVLAGATANVVGGIVTRTAEGDDADEVLSGTELSQDALAGFVGGAGGHVAEEFVHVPGEPVYKRNVKARVSPYVKALNRRNSAVVKQTFLGASAHATTGGLTKWFEELFFSQALQQQQQQSKEVVTHTICFDGVCQ